MSNAEQLLDEVKRLASARLKAARLAAKHEGLVLVDGRRLEQLESLLKAVESAIKTSQMTRDYKDVIAAYPQSEGYNGKRFLVRRNEGRDVMRIAGDLKSRIYGPAGSMVD